jgi:hypothetical protein
MGGLLASAQLLLSRWVIRSPRGREQGKGKPMCMNGGLSGQDGQESAPPAAAASAEQDGTVGERPTRPLWRAPDKLAARAQSERVGVATLEGRRPPPGPSWRTLGAAVGGALAFFSASLSAPDWGEAAHRDAQVATVLAAICLGTGLLYLLLGARPHWLTWLVLGVLFALLGFYELPRAVAPLHLLQAQVAQAAGSYHQEYVELRLGGVSVCDRRAIGALLNLAHQDERAGRYGDSNRRLRDLARSCPASTSAERAQAQVGRTELAYGEQQLSARHYADAVQVFASVQRDYATMRLAPVAWQDAAATYIAWADQ